MVIRTREDLALSLFHGVGAELGVARGYFSNRILCNPHVAKLYSVDRWSDHHDMAEYFEAMAVLGESGQRSTVVRATFEEVLPYMPDQSLSFIYVDGYAHTGQLGGKTLTDWWPKIKHGGIFAGHDYSPQYQPTIDAVDVFVKTHGLEIHLTTEDKLPSWWVVKV